MTSMRNVLADMLTNIKDTIVDSAEQDDGNPEVEYPIRAFASVVDKETNPNMIKYYHRAIGDGVMAVKILVDADGNMLCGVVCKGNGTSYYYDKEEHNNQPAAVCSPMLGVDLALDLVEAQKKNTIITWGGLTAEFRLMHSKGVAIDEWAYIAANHIDMLYQLRTEAGARLNLQAACISLGIEPVEQGAASFKIESAIRDWKGGSPRQRTEIMDAMRAYCKLLMCVYGAVAYNGNFSYKNTGMTLHSAGHSDPVTKISYPITWAKVWQVYNEKWVKQGLNKESLTSEAYATVGVMHNWLAEFAERSKKTMQQLTPPAVALKDLIGKN